MSSGELSVVLGAGPVGRATVDRLVEEGRRVRVVTRSGRSIPGAETAQADLSDAEQAQRACDGASVVFGCVGFDYTGWPTRWPPVMDGMLAGAEAASARFVFMDNLYMYGPVSEPMHEEMPLTDYGKKPATRALLTRKWEQAHEQGRVEAASVRASDFYGPGTTQAALGDISFGRVSQGKSAQVLGDPDQPHAFTYVPDIARALVDVADAEDAMGQAWNVPNAPARSVREVVQMFAHELGQDEVKLQKLPSFMLSVIGLFNENMREVTEMLYQWQGPFLVDSSKFEERFWNDPTPLEEGIAATAAWYRDEYASAS